MCLVKELFNDNKRTKNECVSKNKPQIINETYQRMLPQMMCCFLIKVMCRYSGRDKVIVLTDKNGLLN